MLSQKRQQKTDEKCQPITRACQFCTSSVIFPRDQERLNSPVTHKRRVSTHDGMSVRNALGECILSSGLRDSVLPQLAGCMQPMTHRDNPHHCILRSVLCPQSSMLVPMIPRETHGSSHGSPGFLPLQCPSTGFISPCSPVPRG